MKKRKMCILHGGEVADHVMCTHVRHGHGQLKGVVFGGGKILCPDCAEKYPDLKEDELLPICESCACAIFDIAWGLYDENSKHILVEYHDPDDLNDFPKLLREMVESGTPATPAEIETAEIRLIIPSKKEKTK